jgi:hypothetical protein
MKGLEKLPSEAKTVNAHLVDRNFISLKNNEAIGSGVIVRTINKDCVEATYKHSDEEEERMVIFNVTGFHYDDQTKTGFCWGPVQHTLDEVE